MIYADNTIIIQTDEDLETLAFRYNERNVNSLADMLWYDYGITLVDKRC